MPTLKEWISYGIGYKYCDTLRSHDNIGIEREDMPQIPDDVHGAFVFWLMQRRVAVQEDREYSVGLIKFTQEDIDLEKVKYMISSAGWQEPVGSGHPYLISEEGYLLDGHHRFIAELYGDSATHVFVFQIKLPILELIDLAHKFTEENLGDFLDNAQPRT